MKEGSAISRLASSGTPLPFVARDEPDVDRILLHAHLDRRALTPGFAKALGDCLGCDVLGIDVGYQSVERLGQERVAHGGGGGFGRVAVAPIGFAERPADFETGPTFGIYHAGAAKQGAVRLALDRPRTIAAQRPMTERT